jgi:hypothetical protein
MNGELELFAMSAKSRMYTTSSLWLLMTSSSWTVWWLNLNVLAVVQTNVCSHASCSRQDRAFLLPPSSPWEFIIPLTTYSQNDHLAHLLGRFPFPTRFNFIQHGPHTGCRRGETEYSLGKGVQAGYAGHSVDLFRCSTRLNVVDVWLTKNGVGASPW